VSSGPPGSSWGRPAAGTPGNADATRGRHLRELLRGRAFAYAAVLGCVVSLLAAAWLESAALAVGGPLAVVATAFALAFAAADRRSEKDFFRAYAASRGLVYAGSIGLPTFTPLLGAGDRRRCEHWMRGTFDGGPEYGLGHYEYEVLERDATGHVKRRRKRSFTICVAELEPGMRLFPGLFLCRRHFVLDGIDHDDWLSHTNRHEVELESARLCDRFELWIDDSQDEVLLRELFTPSFEVLLAEHPLEACFEYRAGTLVVYVERTLEDEGHLDWMREVTAKVAARIAGEVTEARAA
jgi:hypothetical protein